LKFTRYKGMTSKGIAGTRQEFHTLVLIAPGGSALGRPQE
ncbi:hypothetical protein T4D_8993, partial [Trichinella pseudospiralis]